MPRRMKDHGRAEAMLIAAWHLGIRFSAAAQKPGSSLELPDDVEAPSDAEEARALSASSSSEHEVKFRACPQAQNGAAAQPCVHAPPEQPTLILLNGVALADAIMKKSRSRQSAVLAEALCPTVAV